MSKQDERVDIELVNEEKYNNMMGLSTKEKFYFFYDESNNNRKFWLKPKGDSAFFNSDIDEDYVLAGVVYDIKPKVSIEELKKQLKLQNNVKEIKFNRHFAEKSFLECMNKDRITHFLKWIDRHNLYIHFFHINNFYYSLVDIIDSITTIEEIINNKLDIMRVKSTFYILLRKKAVELQEIMYKYDYPNIKNSGIKGFCQDLIKLIDDKNSQDSYERFIIKKLKKAQNAESLPFVQNNEGGIMQKNYSEFYEARINLFENSEHVFDEEPEIQKILKKYRFIKKGVEITNFKFVDSSSEIFVQISDVISGIYGKLFTYINRSDKNSICNDVMNLNETQIKNILLLSKLHYKSNNKNIGFLHSITAQCKHELIDWLFMYAFITKYSEKPILPNIENCIDVLGSDYYAIEY